MSQGSMAGLEPERMLEMLRHRRASRTGYMEEKPVTDEQVTLLLEAARAAPSGANAQPWEFIVIRDRAMRNQIADLYKRQLSDKLELERVIRGAASVSGHQLSSSKTGKLRSNSRP